MACATVFWRGLVGGVVGLGCCVGPALAALERVMSASTAVFLA
jgi:hypothetical protein